MKRENKNKKKLAGIVGLLAVTLIGGTMAYYSSSLSVDNILKTKAYGNELVEKFTPEDDWQPGAVVNKDVAVKNTGDYPLLARVTWSETWEKADDTTETVTLKEEKAGSKNSQVIKKIVEGTNWVYSEQDGYYYYNGTIDGGDSVKFLDSITLKDDVDMTGTATTKYYYSDYEGDEEPTDEDWKEVDAESKIPTTAKYKKVVSVPAANSYGNAEYTLTITTEVLQATKEAVNGTQTWKPFMTACGEVYNSLSSN